MTTSCISIIILDPPDRVRINLNASAKLNRVVMLPLQLRWYVVSIVVAFVVDVVFVLALIVFSHCIRLHVLRNSPVDVLQAHSVAPER